jgi:hypothetical protein
MGSVEIDLVCEEVDDGEGHVDLTWPFSTR